jgi:hypothetical protein
MLVRSGRINRPDPRKLFTTLKYIFMKNAEYSTLQEVHVFPYEQSFFAFHPESM